jgi:hypothetical protein
VLHNPFLTDVVDGINRATLDLAKGTVTTIGALQAPGSQHWSENELRSVVECRMLTMLMVLHAPRSEILNFAHLYNTDHEQMSTLRRLEQWVQEDAGRTARTAVTYAAGLLACLRRKACYTSHDPTSALIAILILWAYSQLAGQTRPREEDMLHSLQIDRSKERSYTVRLDSGWPLGAQLSTDVRAWLDGLPGLKPSLQGIANISRQSAGLRLLDIGIEAVEGMCEWGLSKGLRRWLSGLKRRCEES